MARTGLVVVGTILLVAPWSSAEEQHDGLASLRELPAALRDSLGPLLAKVPRDAVLPTHGIGFGDVGLSDLVAWPHCDAIYLVVAYFGIPGDALVHSVKLPVAPPADVCGGAFGPSAVWKDVSFTAPFGRTLAACGRAQVLVAPPATPMEGLAGGTMCGWGAACASGIGTLLRVELSHAITVDAFVASQATVAMGRAGSPGPACA